MTPRAGAARAQQSSHVMQSNVAEAVHRTAADGRTAAASDMQKAAHTKGCERKYGSREFIYGWV